ncbi:hypothetical protein ACSFBI_27445, partial [Variovorax sp. RB3P1]|uniref:hypothetical protein n=1 Tax=Variovorax sp. RB3P1 TaxID=3443732 RepID=UPI003F47F63D
VTQACAQVLQVAIEALDCVHQSSGAKTRGLHYFIYDTVRLRVLKFTVMGSRVRTDRNPG